MPSFQILFLGLIPNIVPFEWSIDRTISVTNSDLPRRCLTSRNREIRKEADNTRILESALSEIWLIFSMSNQKVVKSGDPDIMSSESQIGLGIEFAKEVVEGKIISTYLCLIKALCSNDCSQSPLNSFGPRE